MCGLQSRGLCYIYLHEERMCGQGTVPVQVASNEHAALLVTLQSIASKTAPVLHEDGRWWSSGFVQRAKVGR